MQMLTVYCSACDHDVKVALLHAPDLSTTVDPTAYVCTQCGEQCTGSLCPITDLSPAAMRDALAKSGLAPS